MSALFILASRDAALSLGEGGVVTRALALFLLSALIFAFAVGPDLPLLARLAPAAVWIAAIFAAQLTFDQLFQSDREDGVLDAFLGARVGMERLVLAKCLAHWATTGLPLALAAPLIAIGFGIEGALIGPLSLALLIGTPVLSLIGAVAAAVTATVRRGGALTTLIAAPLYAPAVIFGVRASATPFTSPVSANADMLLLAAVALFALVFAPFAAAAALRLAAA